MNYDIKLENRYNEPIGLKSTGNTDEYTLEGNLDYMRVLYNERGYDSVYAVDPSGGPFISVGNFTINNDSLKLDSITDINGKFTLKFKPNV